MVEILKDLREYGGPIQDNYLFFLSHTDTLYCRHMNIHPPEHKESSDEAP